MLESALSAVSYPFRGICKHGIQKIRNQIGRRDSLKFTLTTSVSHE